jgi:two-component system, OmpR family, response regulator PhoP
MTTPPRLALIDDDPCILDYLLGYLRGRGYPAWGVESAEAFYKALHRQAADIVLVDLSLPGDDGLSVIEYLRASSSRGLVAVTARSDRDDRVNGLLQGADYYLVKPLYLLELDAAITALWRRMRMPLWAQDTSEQNLWTLDPAQSRLYFPLGASLDLSDKEFALTRALIDQAGLVVSKARLHEAVFSDADSVDPHRIDVIVSRLRKKAEEAGLQLPIRAVFGKGMVFILSRNASGKV